MDAHVDAQPSVPAVSPNPQAGLIEYTHWVYALYALSLVTGVAAIIALIMNYLRHSETRGTWLETHFRWQIRTFWFSLLWIVVSSIVAAPLLLLFGIGFVLGLFAFSLVGLWFIYRIARGWLTLRELRPMPLAMQ
jgi:uncharacterized membrane protein